VLGPDVVDGLLHLWEPEVTVRLPDAVARGLERLRDALRRRLLGASRTLVWAHGDFGFGNALVDADSGALRAVIDWETAHDADLAGVDLLNFLVQAHRMARHAGFAESLRHVGRGLLAGARRETDRETGAYFNRFAIGPDQIREALGLCCLRWVLREARYAELFARTAGDAEAAVRWAGEVLAAPE
jgi:aminoglycoside phosphotransferase (APT) family kinase protein